MTAPAQDPTQEHPGAPPPPVRRDELNVFQRMLRSRTDYVYVLPAIILMAIIIAYPIFYTVRLSFYSTPKSLAMDQKIWVGLDNYRKVLEWEQFHNTTVQTMVWTVVSTTGALLLGLGTALVVARNFRLRGISRGILMVPWVVSAVAAAYVWRWILHSDLGLLSAILMRVGIISEPIVFLDDPNRAMWAIILVNIWKEFPFAMIMLLAGLQTVPDQLYRAALVDGAGTVNRFLHVTLPHLRSVTIVTGLLLILQNLNSFTLVWLMTSGGPVHSTDIWIVDIYVLAFQKINFGVASAYSVILFLVMMSFGWFYVRALSGGSSERRAA